MNRVTYLSQNGFIVTNDDVIMVFDYVTDPAHALKHVLDQNQEKPVIFFVSHYHPGHLNKSIYELAQNHKRTYIMSNDVLPQNVPDSLAVAGMSKGDILDNLPGGIMVNAFAASDSGISFLVTTKNGNKIFYAGNMKYNSDDEPDKKDTHTNKENFNIILNRIATEMPAADIAFFPTNGAIEFLNKIKVSDFFPMFIEGDNKDACKFTEYIPSGTTCHCLHTPGESINLG